MDTSETVGNGKYTVVFFDWDDTLLSSTYLADKGYGLDTDMSTPHATLFLDSLKDLESRAINAVNLALSYAQAVHIVTNAETGWVQLSAAKFLPGFVPLLERVSVLSARSTFEGSFPDNPVRWKFHAFQERLSHLIVRPCLHKNIISLGDSHVEREAIRAMTSTLPNTQCKSIKFAERPMPEQLERQLELVVNCLDYVYHHDGDLDLCMSVSDDPPPNTEGVAVGPSALHSQHDEVQEHQPPSKQLGQKQLGQEQPCGRESLSVDNIENIRPPNPVTVI